MLLLGDEELLVSRAVERVVAAARAHDPDAEVTDRIGSSLDVAEFYEMLSPSLFGGRRVLVLRSAHELKAEQVTTLSTLLASPVDDVTVVIHHAGAVRGKAVLDLARKHKAPQLTCAKLTRPEERMDFVRGEVRRAGGTITADAAAALIDAVGSDLRELSSAAIQLVGDTDGRINAELVAAYHEGRAEVSGFAVADLAVAGDTGRALESLRWALSVGVPQVVIADALADGVRSVARVSGLGRANPNELAPRLGMPPWKVRRAQSQARGWSERGLRNALGCVAELNADVKGVAVDPDYALERAVLRLGRARQLR
ncbi:MAG: DNA polymerase III subunit delta [Actinobacteria bacterium]|nr:DNA polymerase III subunit delta [Actinomycetota bacterium]